MDDGKLPIMKVFQSTNKIFYVGDDSVLGKGAMLLQLVVEVALSQLQNQKDLFLCLEGVDELDDVGVIHVFHKRDLSADLLLRLSIVKPILFNSFESVQFARMVVLDLEYLSIASRAQQPQSGIR